MEWIYLAKELSNSGISFFSGHGDEQSRFVKRGRGIIKQPSDCKFGSEYF